MTVAAPAAPLAPFEEKRLTLPLPPKTHRQAATADGGSGSMSEGRKRHELDPYDPKQLSSLKDIPSKVYHEDTVKYTKDSVFHNRVELYRGSVSVVYKAICATSAREVIVKAYKIHRMSPKQIHKAKREIELMKALREDSGVVRYLGHFEDPVMTFIVMEYCKQGDLFRLLHLKGGHVEEPWAVGMVVKPLLEVLSRLHEKKIFHRDIKPENLFFSSDWKLKLGDFGLALDANKEYAFTRSGTLDYMAPEVLANPATDLTEGPLLSHAHLTQKNVKPYDEKVDVWAMGILAYELIVGRPPFEVENEQYTMKLIMKSNQIPFPPHHSNDWADFVSLALKKKPHERPSSHELLQHPWVLKHTNPAAWKARVMAQTCAAAPRNASKPSPAAKSSSMPSMAALTARVPRDSAAPVSTNRNHANAQQHSSAVSTPMSAGSEKPGTSSQPADQLHTAPAPCRSKDPRSNCDMSGVIVTASTLGGTKVDSARSKGSLSTPSAAAAAGAHHQKAAFPAGVLGNSDVQERGCIKNTRPQSANGVFRSAMRYAPGMDGCEKEDGERQERQQGLRIRMKQYLKRQIGSSKNVETVAEPEV